MRGHRGRVDGLAARVVACPGLAWNPYPSLPTGAVRDLLGIARSLYRVAREAEPRDEVRLQALEQIGVTLRSALQDARSDPATIAHSNAWAATERATKALAELVAQDAALVQLVAATARVLSPRRGSMV